LKIVFLNTNMKGPGLEYILNTFQRIKTLHLTLESEKQLSLLHRLKELQELHLSIPFSITIAYSRHFVIGEKLRKLKVNDQNQFSDDALLAIGSLTTLQHLEITQDSQYRCIDLMECDIRPISKLTNMVYLSMTRFALADDAFQLLCQHLTKLETLVLASSHCTDKGLSSMHCLTSLTRLDLRYCKGYTTNFLLHLVLLPLQSLSFNADICEVEGATVRNSEVSGLNQIRTLKEVLVMGVTTASLRNSLAVITNSLCHKETWKLMFRDCIGVVESLFTR